MDIFINNQSVDPDQLYSNLLLRASVRNVLFPKYLEESLLDFHQTLQTCSYMQDKYFRQKSKG